MEGRPLQPLQIFSAPGCFPSRKSWMKTRGADGPWALFSYNFSQSERQKSCENAALTQDEMEEIAGNPEVVVAFYWLNMLFAVKSYGKKLATFSHPRTPLRTWDRTLGLSRAFWTVSTSFTCRKHIHLKRHVLFRKHLPAFSMCPMSLNLKVKLWQPHLHCYSALEFHESPIDCGEILRILAVPLNSSYCTSHPPGSSLTL